MKTKIYFSDCPSFTFGPGCRYLCPCEGYDPICKNITRISCNWRHDDDPFPHCYRGQNGRANDIGAINIGTVSMSTLLLNIVLIIMHW